MKIFLDTANVDEIKEASAMGLIDGVTTNPTLIAREVERTGAKFSEILKEICSAVNGPVSAEVVSLDYEGMVKEAKILAGIADNIAIKIPMTADGMKAVRTLSKEGIMTNVTLVFHPLQALLAAKAGATFVSPFVGRLDDISSDGMKLVKDIVQIYRNYNFKTEVIVASVRHPMHLLISAKAGADISTIPPAVLKWLTKHPLTDAGIERFLNDWEKVKDANDIF